MLELRFVGMVTGGETVEATVDVDGEDATVTVTGTGDERVRVVGRASRRGALGGH